MSAEASVGSHAAASIQSACQSTDEHRSQGLLGSKYVKLNVGGSLHYTTVQTLSKEESLLRSICNGGTEVTIDSEGECVMSSNLPIGTALLLFSLQFCGIVCTFLYYTYNIK